MPGESTIVHNAVMEKQTNNAVIGTLPWARATLGALSRKDTMSLLRQAFQFQANMVGSLLFRRGRGTSDLIPIIEAELPDSAIARRAVTLCAEVSPLTLFHHCCRAYVWGKLLANLDGIAFDDELLFVACMLHDLGLTASYSDCARHGACFTLDSVEAGSPILKEAGWEQSRQDAVAEAILLHMNVVVPISQGAEAHLLHEAAGFDCLGLRTWEIKRPVRDAVVAKYPREKLKPFLIETFGAETARRPRGRAAFLQRYMMLFPLVRLAPFEE